MNKKLQHITLVLIGVIAFNILGSIVYHRFDLTHDNRYSLSAITKKISSKIDNQLLINVYLEGDFPAEFKRLQVETRQYLEELKTTNKNIIVRFINPERIRERLVKKGMTATQLTVEEGGKLSEEIIFPWAEVIYGKKTEIVSLLPTGIMNSQEEQLQKAIENLEYGFSNAINTILKSKKQKIAILRGNGELEDVYLYSFLNEVRKKYHLAKFTLDSVEINPQKTLQELTRFDLAIIAKPTQKFTDKEKQTIDQYITNGGKTLWMLENTQADQDSLFTTGKMLAYPRDLNITDLFFSYGVRINSSIIKDLYAAKISLATGKIGNQTQFKNLPWFFHPLAITNPTHPITKNVSPVRMQFVNQIDTLQNSIKKTPLIVSSILTQKIGTPKIIELQEIAKEPKQEDYASGPQLFAVLLEGEFTSMYKSRIKPFETNLYKEKSKLNKMIIVADGDVGKNQILKGRPHDLSYDKWTNEQFGNKEFLLNSVDYLLDDSGLINLRNKSLQINNLDKQQAYNERSFWQFFNIILPLFLLFGFGFGFNYWRKKKYIN